MADWVCPNCRFWIGLPDDWGEKAISCPSCNLTEGQLQDLPEPPPRLPPQIPTLEEFPFEEPVAPSPLVAALVLTQTPPRPEGPKFRWQQWLLRPSPSERLLRMVFGWVLYVVILVGGLLITAIIANLGKDNQGRGTPGPWTMAFLALFWTGVGTALRYARRWRASLATEVTRRDLRPPVLILRAFIDDQIFLDGFEREESWTTFGIKVTQTFEEYLHDRFSQIGPVVACGQPGWLVPPLGAARFWIPHEHWQKVIGELLSESQLVVMIMGELVRDEVDWKSGREDGLLWEARRVAELAATEPQKVILVVPPLDEERVQRRWEQYQRLFGNSLPDYLPGMIAIGFESGGSPVIAGGLTAGGNLKRSDRRAYDDAIRIVE
jgi:hypothetical protein